MLEAAVYSLVTNDATLTGLIGTKIYSMVAPQTTSGSYIVYRRISTVNRDLTHDSKYKSAQALLQFDCFADSILTAKTIADALRELLQGYSGTVGGQLIMVARVANERDSVDVDLGYYVSVDIEISYRETY